MTSHTILEKKLSTIKMASLNDLVPSGVVTGDDLLTLLEHARANSYAIPAVNCTRYVNWALLTCWSIALSQASGWTGRSALSNWVGKIDFWS